MLRSCEKKEDYEWLWNMKNIIPTLLPNTKNKNKLGYIGLLNLVENESMVYEGENKSLIPDLSGDQSLMTVDFKRINLKGSVFSPIILRKYRYNTEKECISYRLPRCRLSVSSYHSLFSFLGSDRRNSTIYTKSDLLLDRMFNTPSVRIISSIFCLPRSIY